MRKQKPPRRAAPVSTTRLSAQCLTLKSRRKAPTNAVKAATLHNTNTKSPTNILIG